MEPIRDPASETGLSALTRRAFLGGAALLGAAAAVLGLAGCAAPRDVEGTDGAPFFDDGTGFVA